MAGRGPAPKDPAKRIRVNKPTTAETVITADDEVRGPELPAQDAGWPGATLAWWENWRRSPQAQLMTATDWDFLLDTAILHAEFWNGQSDRAAELRLRVAKFGATPEDRARLHMQIEQEPQQAAKPRRPTRLRVVDTA